jgi:hypothetical protein
MTQDAKKLGGQAGGDGDGPMFIVKPDKDGLIRISHHGATFHLFVKQGNNPWDIPYPYIVAPEGDHVDVEATTKELLRRFTTQSEPDPGGLVLRVRELNLDSLAMLKRKIHETHPEVPLGVDLSGFDKP